MLEVTIDRPKANAIDAATSRIMGDIFANFRDDPELRCAILTATGEKFFCPGWDLKAAAAGEAPDSDYGVGDFGLGCLIEGGEGNALRLGHIGDQSSFTTRTGHGHKARAFCGAAMVEEFQGLDKFGDGVDAGHAEAPEQAATQAEKLGFPVTVKASSVSIAHKTEAGGVALNLRDAAAVRQASRRMAKLADEVLVERMVKGTVTELIIGITSDEQFGQALVIGAGGIFTELLRDSVTLILPVTDTQIDQALSTLKIAKLIDGFRNRSGDRQAVIRAISAVAAFAQANLTTLEELDVNPLMVLPPGEGAIAVDALIRMRKGKSK